jgi:hypothetical protein
MASDVFADIIAVTARVRMDCVRVPAGEFLMGSSLAKDREASRVNCLSYAPGRRSGHVGFGWRYALLMGKRTPHRS